jgi:hypothetical protein
MKGIKREGNNSVVILYRESHLCRWYSFCCHCHMSIIFPRSMISELENGRLAMLAFVVQIVLELVTKESIVKQWESVLTTIATVKK